MEARAQVHGPSALHPGKEPPVAIEWRLGGRQNCSERSGEEKKNDCAYRESYSVRSVRSQLC